MSVMHATNSVIVICSQSVRSAGADDMAVVSQSESRRIGDCFSAHASANVGTYIHTYMHACIVHVQYIIYLPG